MKDLRLYIHVPFCQNRCVYCDFVTFADKSYLIDSYFESINTEIALHGDKISKANIKSVFLGGGTPSYPPADFIKGTLEKLNINEDTEISIEANPGTICLEKLQKYREMGINRISLGVQSFDNDILTVMGRIHDRTTAIKNIEETFRAGFTNVSIDLMFGYPMQTEKIFNESLKIAVELGVDHISCYSLIVEDSTLLYNMIKNGVLKEIDEQTDRNMYEMAKQMLGTNGYNQYEISNFAKPSFECKHNIGYWKLDEYIGIGLAAHSYYAGCRYSNTENISEYIRSIKKYKIPEIYSENIDKKESIKEYIILGLRLTDGINTKDFKEKYGKDVFHYYGNEIMECIKKNLLEYKNEKIRLTKSGMNLANQVFINFI